jgi:hypothetical protein
MRSGADALGHGMRGALVVPLAALADGGAHAPAPMPAAPPGLDALRFAAEALVRLETEHAGDMSALHAAVDQLCASALQGVPVRRFRGRASGVHARQHGRRSPFRAWRSPRASCPPP